MLSFLVPTLVRAIADRYKDILESVPYPMLCAYIASFVLGSDSLASLVRCAPWTPSLSTLSTGLNNFSSTNLNRAMQRLRWSVLKRVLKSPDDWIFAFDTTANPKRVKGLVGRGMWATSNGNTFDGRNLVVLVVVNIRTGHAIPVAWAPCIKPKDDPVNGKPAWKIVLDLLDELVNAHFPKLAVVGDSWFDGVPFLQQLDARGFMFNVELKSSRKAKINISPKAKWGSLQSQICEEKKVAVVAGTRGIIEMPAGLKGCKFLSSKIMWIRESQPKDKTKRLELRIQVTAVFNHAAEKKPFAYYATNDQTKSGAWQWRMSRCRWNIEVLFRDLKQELVWGELPCRSQIGNDVSITLPFLIVAHIRLDEKNRVTDSIGTILARVRQSETLRSIEYVISNPKHGLYVKFANRMDPIRACLKPVDSVAETKHSRESVAIAS